MSLLDQHLLSILIALPVAGAIAVALTPRSASGVAKVLGLGVSILVFLLSLVLLRGFEPTASMQFQEHADWMPMYGISYHVGVDGISLWLILLTTFLTPLALIGSWESIQHRVREFVLFMLLL